MVKRAIFVLLILASFALACGMPTYNEIRGVSALAFAPYLATDGSLFGVAACFSWFANLFLLFGLICMVCNAALESVLIKKVPEGSLAGTCVRVDQIACVFAAIGLMLATLPGIEFCVHSNLHFQSEPHIALESSGHGPNQLRLGYFLWVATHWHLLVGAATFYLWDRRTNIT